MIRFYLTTFALMANLGAAAFCAFALADYGFGYIFAWGLFISFGMVALCAVTLIRIGSELDDQAVIDAYERDPLQVRLDKSWMNQG